MLCLRRRAPYHCGDFDPSRLIVRTFVVLSFLALHVLGKCTNMELFPHLDKLLVYVQVMKSSIMRRGDWSKWNHKDHYSGNIRLKERPASSGNRAPKRNISDVLSDHSFSSWLRNHLRSWFSRFPLLIFTKWRDELWFPFLDIYPSSQVFSLWPAHNDPRSYCPKKWWIRSFIRYRFPWWVRADPNDTFERHMVDVRKAFEEFHEASVRRQDASYQEFFVDKHRSPVQKGCVYCWNLGPRHGKERAIEKQSAGTWHTITLQEVIEYVDRELFTNSFACNHHGGCAVFFNKGTFPHVKVIPIFLHVTRRELLDQVMEGDLGHVLSYHVPLLAENLSAAKRDSRSCCCTSLTFTPRNVALEKAYPYDSCSEAWRKGGPGCRWFQRFSLALRQQEQHQYSRRSICWLLCRFLLDIYRGDLDCFLASGPMFVDSLHFLVRMGTGKFGFSVLFHHETLAIRPTDQRCHHEAWFHFDWFAWGTAPTWDKHDRKILLKERSAPFITANTKDTWVILWDTIRFRRDIETIRARPWRDLLQRCCVCLHQVTLWRFHFSAGVCVSL